MQGMAVMSWKAWHPSNTCHTSSHNFRPLQSSPESSWNFPGMQFHFERKVMRSYIWDILMKFECSGKRTWPKYKGVESRETANGRPPNAYQRCSNGGMVVGPAICVQEFLVGFTYSVPFLWEIWLFFVYMLIFRNVSESADMVFVVTFWYCVYRDHLLLKRVMTTSWTDKMKSGLFKDDIHFLTQFY